VGVVIIIEIIELDDENLDLMNQMMNEVID
jgi:hypothetical protein